MDHDLRAALPQCLHSLLTDYASADEIPLPLTHASHAAVMFLDLSRFTMLTESASRGGRYGVEIITDLLDAYFDVVVGAVRKYGGSLVKFGGDSTLSLFPGAFEDAGARALACRNEVLAVVGAGFAIEGGAEPVKLHGAVGYGDVQLHITGDPALHIDYYPSGDVLTRVFSRGDDAGPGEVLIIDGLDALSPTASPCPGHDIDCGLAPSFLSQAVQRKLRTLDFRAELRNTAICFLQVASDDDAPAIAPQVYHRAYLAIQRLASEFGGAVNKIDYTDKGYMIILTFGAPDMHYDDIERAFICAYRLQRLELDGVKLRIGVTCSNIYAGVLGAPRRFEYGVIGNAVNTAARLMEASDWGGVAFSREIQPRIMARFESEFVRRVQVKGISEPVELHRLLRELPESWSAYRSRYDAVRMLGRSDLLKQLSSRLAANESVRLRGGACVGKSLLLYQLAEPLVDDKRNVQLFAFDEFDARRPLGLVSRVMEHILDTPPLPIGLPHLVEWIEREEAKVDARLLEHALGGAAIDDERDLVLDALAGTLVHACRDLDLLAIDNAQWLDKQSQQILERLLPLLDGVTPCITSERVEYLEEELREGVVHTQYTVLTPFDETLAFEYVQQFLPSVTHDAVKALHRITGGVPTFLAEMARIVDEHIDASVTIINATEIRILIRRGVIPESMENLLLAQYERLDDDAQRVLRIAAIVGRAFSVDTLRMVGRAGFSREVMDVLASLEDSALINEQNINPEIEYIFSNNLMREAIYRQTPRGEKRELHNRIAEWYAQRAQSEEEAWCEVTANHYVLSGDKSGVRKWAAIAADKNRRMGAVSDSLYFYEAALRAGANDPMISLRIAEALLLLGRVKQADKLLATEPPAGEARDLHRYLLVKALAIRADYAGQKRLIESWTTPCEGAWYGKMLRLHYLEALQALGELAAFEQQAREFLQELESASDTEFLGRLASLMGLFYQEQARYDEAREWFERKLAVSQSAGDQYGLRLAQASLGIVASRLGDKQLAADWYAKALETAERIGDRNGYGKTLMDMAILERNAGRNDKAREIYERCLTLARQIGNKRLEQLVLYNYGESFYNEDRIEEGRAYILQALELARHTGDKVGVSYCYDALGDASFILGDYSAAHDYYSRNVPLQEKLGDIEGLAHTYGNLGNLAKMESDWDTAIERYSAQQRMLADVGDRDGEGRAWFNWAMIYVEKGEDPRAVEPLQRAIGCFRACEAKQLVAIAEEQMTELRKRLQA